jgi:hypothetical protein
VGERNQGTKTDLGVGVCRIGAAEVGKPGFGSAIVILGLWKYFTRIVHCTGASILFKIQQWEGGSFIRAGYSILV